MNIQTEPRNPLVSVLIPAYNAETTIRFTLASLAAQTVEAWEAVVVDDGSTDQTVAVVESVRDPRIRIFRLEVNRGRGAARQVALERCRGEFLATVDADDWWYPWKLERQLRIFKETPDLGLVSAAMASVGINGEFRGIWRSAGPSGHREQHPPLRSLSRIEVPHAPSMVRIQLARSVGYDTALDRAEDFVFLARVLQRTSYLLSPRVLYAYTDEESFRREGAPGRYLCAAGASLRLLRAFGARAAVHAGRNLIQALVATLPFEFLPAAQNRLHRPTAGDFGEFDKARTHVQAVLSTIGG